MILMFRLFFLNVIKPDKTKKKYCGRKITPFFPCSLGAGSGNRTCGSWLRGSHCEHCNAYKFSR